MVSRKIDNSRARRVRFSLDSFDIEATLQGSFVVDLAQPNFPIAVRTKSQSPGQ